MKIGQYKKMVKFITRPGTPEQNKRAEENKMKLTNATLIVTWES